MKEMGKSYIQKKINKLNKKIHRAESQKEHNKAWWRKLKLSKLKDKNLDIKNTVIVKDGNRDLKKSEAVILMLDKINFKKTSFFIKIFQTFIRNLVYDFIARYRYNIFGKIKKNGN